VVVADDRGMELIRAATSAMRKSKADISYGNLEMANANVSDDKMRVDLTRKIYWRPKKMNLRHGAALVFMGWYLIVPHTCGHIISVTYGCRCRSGKSYNASTPRPLAKFTSKK